MSNQQPCARIRFQTRLAVVLKVFLFSSAGIGTGVVAILLISPTKPVGQSPSRPKAAIDTRSLGEGGNGSAPMAGEGAISVPQPVVLAMAAIKEERDVANRKAAAEEFIDWLQRLAEGETPEVRQSHSRLIGALRAGNRAVNATDIQYWEGICFNNLFYGGWHEYGADEKGKPYGNAWKLLIESIANEKLDNTRSQMLINMAVAYAGLADDYAVAIEQWLSIGEHSDSTEILLSLDDRHRAYMDLYYSFLGDLRGICGEKTYSKVSAFLSSINFVAPE